MATYTVQRGDTLRGIALKFYGDANKFTLIQTANKLSDPNQINVGDILQIPDRFTSNSGLKLFHRAFSGGVRWRLVQQGIEVEGSGIERTSGSPATVTKIWQDFSTPINQWADHFDVPCVIIIATIATESNGNPNALRKEPGFISDTATPNKISPGLMQTLISTARAALNDNSISRNDLFKPSKSIEAGTAFIADQRSKTLLDPPKVACAYNAGSIFNNASSSNRWRMRQFPIGTSHHCDRFVKFFNDAVFVLSTHATKASISYEDFYL